MIPTEAFAASGMLALCVCVFPPPPLFVSLTMLMLCAHVQLVLTLELACRRRRDAASKVAAVGRHLLLCAGVCALQTALHARHQHQIAVARHQRCLQAQSLHQLLDHAAEAKACRLAEAVHNFSLLQRSWQALHSAASAKQQQAAQVNKLHACSVRRRQHESLRQCFGWWQTGAALSTQITIFGHKVRSSTCSSCKANSSTAACRPPDQKSRPLV